MWSSVLREHAALRVHSQEELLDVALWLDGAALEKLPGAPAWRC